MKNSNPVTMRLLAPPAAGACVFPYPHILVTKLAYASVAPLRTSQCGDLNPRTQTSTPRETNAVVSVATDRHLTPTDALSALRFLDKDDIALMKQREQEQKAGGGGGGSSGGDLEMQGLGGSTSNAITSSAHQSAAI